jgi:hypothetical protein
VVELLSVPQSSPAGDRAAAAGTQTESVKLRTEELFGGEQARTVPVVKQANRDSDDPVDRRRAMKALGYRGR